MQIASRVTRSASLGNDREGEVDSVKPSKHVVDLESKY